MSKYLLDTHTLIWFAENNEKLPQKVAQLILDENNLVFVSIASLWEITIKKSMGKLDIDLYEILDKTIFAEFAIMQVKTEYLKVLVNLPFIHKDPFDRLLVSTAKSENMKILTADENIHKYEVECVW